MYPKTILVVALTLALAGLPVSSQEPTPSLTEAVKILQLQVIEDLKIRIADLDTEAQRKEEEAEGLRTTIENQQRQIDTIPGLNAKIVEQGTLIEKRENFTKSLHLKIEGLEKGLEGGKLMVNFLQVVLKQSETLMAKREETISALNRNLQNTVTDIEQNKYENEVCMKHQQTLTETISIFTNETESLKNIISYNNKLNASCSEIATMMSTSKDIPAFAISMVESLSDQQKEITDLKTALEGQGKVEENIQIIKTEILKQGRNISQTDSNCSLPSATIKSFGTLLAQQSESLKHMRVVASYSEMAAGSGLRYQDNGAGHLVSASSCQCLPDVGNSTVSLTLARQAGTLQTMWGSWDYQGCFPWVTNGLTRECGTGGRRVRKRLRDIDSPTWEEEEQVEQCEDCSTPWGEWGRCRAGKMTREREVEDVGAGRMRPVNETQICVDSHRQCFQPYTTLSESWRRVVYSSSKQAYGNCDNTLGGWYGFSFPGQPNGSLAQIPTSPPASQYTWEGKTCGTQVSAWMAGSLPALGEPPKDVTMKFAYQGQAEFRTGWNRKAKVVTCSDESGNTFYLYHLIQTDCNMAYCAITVMI